MREIKSRAWIKSKGIFYYDFAKVPYDVKMEGVVYRIFSGKMDKLQLLQSEFEENLFTVLQDVNGKDIYECDIIEFTFFTYLEVEHEQTKKGQIIFDNFGFCFKVSKDEIYLLGDLEFDSQSQIEIIGNIYENPELIEVSK